MKKFLMLLLLFIYTITLIGCQSSQEKVEMEVLDSITEVSVSKSEGYGGLNENYFTSLKKAEVIANFEEIMRNAKSKDREIDREQLDYDILVHYEDGGTHGLHLLLGNEGEESFFMYIGHEEKIFSVGPEATKDLRQLIKTQE